MTPHADLIRREGGGLLRRREGQAINSLISRLIYPGASRSVDVGQVVRTLQPGEELGWQETARGERIGLIIRPPRPWMAAELTRAMGDHARLVSLPGVGHNDMINSGERLWNVVTDFLHSPEEPNDL